MRTKHILTALVFPAIFAACTADDFNETISNGATAERALLSEDFKLYFDDATTRFSAGEPGEGLSFSYEVGDTIGGAIIDSYGGGDNFTVVNYVSTNHPFVLNANGVWAINHTMVEGNYLFYFPYNENNHARGAVQYSIPVMQDLSGEDGKFNPKAAVEKYNMGVGAQFLDKEDLSASVQLVNIFGYAKIKVMLDNRYAGGYVDKIVLQADNGKSFALNGQISNKKVSALFDKLEDSQEDYEAELKTMTETANFSLDNTDTYYVNELNETSAVMVAKAPEGTALEVDGQNNKSFETYMVLPAAEHKNVKLYLYTTDGNVYVSDPTDFTVVRNGVKSIEVNAARTETVPYVVTSVKDWNDYVDLLAKDATAEFIIAGSDFTITNDVKFPTNGAEITVTGDLKVSGNNVTIKNVTADKVIVEEGAKLTTDGTFGAGEIENNGTLVVAPAYDDDKVVPYKLETVNNMPGASLFVEEETVAEFLLNNQIDDKEEALPYGTVEINGQLTLNQGSTNSGVITNNGSLRGSFTNNKEVIYPTNPVTEKDIKNRVMPTIVNNDEIFATGEVVNNGKVENKKGAEITCSKTVSGAQFNNGGTIELADGSRMLITNNEINSEKGEVILEKLTQTNWSIEQAQGIVAYSTTSTDTKIDFTTSGKGITKLYVNNSLEITKLGSVTDIVVSADATLTLAKDASLAGELTVEEGADLVIVSEKTTVANLVVEKDATVTINENNNLVATAVKNAGTVYVGGTFTTSTTETDAVVEDGEFRSTSSDDTNIKFGNAPVDGDLEEALVNAVNAYVENSNQITDGNVDSWSKLTVDQIKVAGSNWTESWTATYGEAITNAYKAINPDSEKTVDEIMVEYATVIEDAVDAAKATADKELAEAIADMDNSWIDTEVYTLTKEGDGLDKILNGSDQTVAEGFKAYLVDTYKSDKALWLSANDYKVEAVPAYSYIPVYEGATEYTVIATLNQFKGSSGQWNENITEEKLKTLDGLKTAFTVLYNEYNNANSTNLTPMEKRTIKQSGIMEDAVVDAVMNNWNYKADQLSALYTAVQ